MKDMRVFSRLSCDTGWVKCDSSSWRLCWNNDYLCSQDAWQYRWFYDPAVKEALLHVPYNNFFDFIDLAASAGVLPALQYNLICFLFLYWPWLDQNYGMDALGSWFLTWKSPCTGHGIVYPEVWQVPMAHDSGGVLAGGLRKVHGCEGFTSIASYLPELRHRIKKSCLWYGWACFQSYSQSPCRRGSGPGCLDSGLRSGQNYVLRYNKN